jgi:peptidoglycan/LPS O-acetylase OafA/YrhL
VRYRPEIDGLRAISVLGVVAFHFELATAGKIWLRGGYLGVDVFFVISGYLITRILLKDLSLGALPDFYFRRVRRLLPALYLVCASSLALGLYVLPPEALIKLARSAIAGIAFVSNIYFYLTTDYWSEAASLTPLIHLWSLSVEEQFYLFYPALLLLLAGRPKWFALAVPVLMIASLAAALRLPAASPEVFYLSVFRAWELLAGALVGLWHERRRDGLDLPRWTDILPPIGLVLIGLAFILGGNYTANLASVLGAMLVLGTARQQAWPTRVLAWPPAVFLGLISYPLYLWHQPVLAFAGSYFLSDLDLASRLSLVVLCIILAAATWFFVERPIRQGMSLGQTWRLSLPVSVALIVTSLCLMALHGVPQRYNSEQLKLLAASAQRGTTVLEGQNCKTSTVSKPCRIGDPAAPITWALLGDSHAETLSDSVSELLARNGLAGEVLTYPGCPFIVGIEPVYTNEACASFAKDVMETLLKDHIETVIIQDRTTAYIQGTRFDNGEGGVEPGKPFPVRPVGQKDLGEPTRIAEVEALFTGTITGLLDRGIRVIYIAPVPEVGWHVPRVAARLAARGSIPITTSRTRYFERHRGLFKALDTLSGRPGLTVVYPDQTFCDPKNNRCRTASDGELLYTDTDHLSRKGGRFLVEAMGRQLTSLGLLSK